MVPNEPAHTTTVIEPDGFALRVDSALQHEHEMLSSFLREVVGRPQLYKPDLNEFKAGRELLELGPAPLGRALLAAAERHLNVLLPCPMNLYEHGVWQISYATAGAVAMLIERPFELDRAGTFDLLLYLAVLPAHQRGAIANAGDKLVALATRAAATSPLTEGERFVLSLFRASLVSGPGSENPPMKWRRSQD